MSYHLCYCCRSSAPSLSGCCAWVSTAHCSLPNKGGPTVRCTAQHERFSWIFARLHCTPQAFCQRKDTTPSKDRRHKLNLQACCMAWMVFTFIYWVSSKTLAEHKHKPSLLQNSPKNDMAEKAAQGLSKNAEEMSRKYTTWDTSCPPTSSSCQNPSLEHAPPHCLSSPPGTVPLLNKYMRSWRSVSNI